MFFLCLAIFSATAFGGTFFFMPFPGMTDVLGLTLATNLVVLVATGIVSPVAFAIFLYHVGTRPTLRDLVEKEVERRKPRQI